MKFAEQDAEIDRLRRLVGDQNDRLGAFAALGVKDPKAKPEPKPEEEAAFAPLFDQRQAEVEQLNAAVKANEEKLKGLSSAAAKQSGEAAPTQSSPPHGGGGHAPAQHTAPRSK
jgi:hypothetical protein